MADFWADQIRSHVIHDLLNQQLSAIDSAERVKGLETEAASYLRRLRVVTLNIQARLERTQPELIPRTTLDQVVSQVQPLIQYLLNFESDSNVGHLHNASGHADILLKEFQWLQPLTGRQESQPLISAYRRLVENVEASEKDIRERQELVQQEIAAASNEVLANRGILASIQMEAQQSAESLSTKIDAAASNLTTEVTAEKTRLDTFIQQQQAAYVETQAERQKEFEALIAQEKRDVESALSAALQEVRDANTRIMAEANSALATLKDHELSASQIVGVTAAAGVTGSYINEATEQRTAADKWRLGAIVFLILTVVAALATAIWSPLNNDSVSSQDIIEYGLARVPIVVVLGLITTYLIAQSGDHRKREQHARRRAMELTAFRPFISELSQEDQQELIRETARKYFKGDEDAPPPSEAAAT